MRSGNNIAYECGEKDDPEELESAKGDLNERHGERVDVCGVFVGILCGDLFVLRLKLFASKWCLAPLVLNMQNNFVVMRFVDAHRYLILFLMMWAATCRSLGRRNGLNTVIRETPGGKLFFL